VRPIRVYLRIDIRHTLAAAFGFGLFGFVEFRCSSIWARVARQA
jgi:hypothetical protein